MANQSSRGRKPRPPQKHRDRCDRVSFAIGVGTLVVAVIAMGAAIFAAIYTKGAAEGTWAQVKELRKSAKIELRAYVSVIPSHVFNVRANQRWTPYVIFRNVGQTPARNVLRRMALTISLPLSREDEARFGEGDLIEGSPALSAAADSAVYKEGEMVPDEMAEEIRSGKLRLYVWGRADFVDIFGDHRWITFCHFYTGQMATPSSQPNLSYLGSQAIPCTSHNDTSDASPE